MADFNTHSGSERGIITGDDKGSLEMDTLSAESRQIHKQTEYDVRDEDLHTRENGSAGL